MPAVAGALKADSISSGSASRGFAGQRTPYSSSVMPIDARSNPMFVVVATTSPMLDLVGLARRYAASYPSQLSGGQRQRVAIARALVQLSSALPIIAAAVLDHAAHAGTRAGRILGVSAGIGRVEPDGSTALTWRP